MSSSRKRFSGRPDYNDAGVAGARENPKLQPVSSENFSRESLRKSQEGVNELLVQLDAQSHGTTQRMTCHRQDADLAIRLNATLLPYLISQDFLSFHHLASFIDVALADEAERDIQAIPRVAQFSLPGQGPL